MTEFWIAVGLMAFVAAAVLFAALRYGGRKTPVSRADFDVAVYKDQLAEVERDVERNLLTENEAEAARTEIKRRLLAAADEAGAGAEHAPSPALSRIVTVAVAILAPAGAVAVYLGLGAHGLPDLPFAARDLEAEVAAQNRMAEPSMSGDIETVVGQLASRLKEDPDNVDGWHLLGRSLMTLGRYDDAADAFKNARRIDPDHKDIAAAYAEALIFQKDGDVGAEALALLEDVLDKDFHNPVARFYIGLAKAQKDDMPGALQDWIDLAAIGGPEATWLPRLIDQIDQAAAEIGIDPNTLEPSPGLPRLVRRTPQATPPATTGAPGPTRQQMEDAAGMSAGDRQAMIRSMVERLAERLEDEPDDLQGWVRLERAYRVLGETAKADEAAKRIKALQGN